MRPCLVVHVAADEVGEQIVTVLPITHTPPSNSGVAVEIPHATKQRLRLDDERSWVGLTEANRFTWPGPDLHMAHRDNPASVVCGELPAKLFIQIRDRFIAAITAANAELVKRTH